MLAAYIDGMLSEEEAARVAEHIAECEDCFFVYSETVRFQLDHPDEAADPEPEVIPFPTKTKEKKVPRIPPWLLAAAAALALVSGFFLYRSLALRTMPELITAELTDPVQGVPDLQKSLYPLKTFRGAGEDSEFDRESFMVGVLLVDTRLSLKTGDREGAASRIGRIGTVLEKIFKGSGADLAKEAQRVESGGDLVTTLAKLEQWEKNAGESEDEGKPGNDEEVWLVDPDYVTFGKWAEAARLAAVLQKPEFFERRANRRVLSYVLESEEMRPSDEVVANLREIEKIWVKGNLQPQDFTAIADKFTAILQAYDFTS